MKKSLLLCLLLTGIVMAQVPQTLNYQGVLTDQNGVIVPDNSYSLNFKLYDVSLGGSAIWQETQTLPVSKGLFNAILGTVTPLTIPFDKQYYLGISVAGGAELLPRIAMTSTGYSLTAKTVVDNSITTSKIVDGSVTQSKLAASVSLPPGGTAGGDLSGTFPNPVVNKLQGRTLSTTAPTSGQILSWNGTQWTPTTPSSGLGGAGTSGFISKFTGASVIGNSILFESAGKLSLNKPSPTYTLDIGTAAESDNFIRVTSSGRAGIFFNDAAAEYSGGIFYIHSDDHFEFITTNGTNYAERMRLTKDGRLGIGITTPLGKVHAVTSGKYAGYFVSDSLGANTNVVYSEYTGIGTYDAKGVYGKSAPADGYGLGGYFVGGYRGVYAQVLGGAYNGAVYGVTGSAVGVSPGTRYGVYGSASGGATNFGVYAAGDLGYTGNLIGPSDVKFKENITPLMSGILDKIKLLQPKKYSFTTDSKYTHMNLPTGTHYGLIAQELETVFPELVKNAVHPSAQESSGGKGGEPVTYKGVVMTELIPILIQAVKEQQQQIEELKVRIDQLEKK